MKRRKSIPRPLARKILLIPLIGTGCLLLGIGMFISAKDRALLMLSGALFFACLLKGIFYYRIAATGRYEVVRGTCVRIMPQLIGCLRRVLIMDEEGIETTLQLPKSCRIRIGGQYLLYFTRSSDYQVGPESLRAALSTDSFLGYELLQEADDQGKKEGLKKDDFL